VHTVCIVDYYLLYLLFCLQFFNVVFNVSDGVLFLEHTVCYVVCNPAEWLNAVVDLDLSHIEYLKLDIWFVVSRRLTWRDLQHITVQTARQANLETDDWVVNGAGRMGIQSVHMV